MADDVMTFEELRRVQSNERDSDTLQELDGDFFERARNYLETKKEGESHLQAQEYRNAKNILQDVLDMRQKKIVKLAFLSVKSSLNVENLLDHEQELFRDLEDTIGAYRHDRQEKVFEGGSGPVETAAREEEVEEEEDVEGGDVSVEEEVEEEVEEDDGEEVQEEEMEDEEPVEEEDVEEPGEGKEEKKSSRRSVDDILEFDTGNDGEGSGKETEESDEEDTGSADDEGEDGAENSPEDRVRVKVQENVPEFMGTDLNAYGPFEEGDEVELPAENADVLEQQGKAERV